MLGVPALVGVRLANTSTRSYSPLMARRYWLRRPPCRPTSGRQKGTKNLEAAAKVGRAIAEKALAAGVAKIAFDRSGYRYHGRIKVGDAVREAACNSDAPANLTRNLSFQRSNHNDKRLCRK